MSLTESSSRPLARLALCLAFAACASGAPPPPEEDSSPFAGQWSHLRFVDPQCGAYDFGAFRVKRNGSFGTGWISGCGGNRSWQVVGQIITTTGELGGSWYWRQLGSNDVRTTGIKGRCDTRDSCSANAGFGISMRLER